MTEDNADAPFNPGHLIGICQSEGCWFPADSPAAPCPDMCCECDPKIYAVAPVGEAKNVAEDLSAAAAKVVAAEVERRVDMKVGIAFHAGWSYAQGPGDPDTCYRDWLKQLEEQAAA